MLQIEGLTVRFGAVTAVDDVDLQVPDAHVVALLGPSGCGKSTLLRCIAGIERPSAGRILWDGADLADVPIHRRRFGLMFQDGVLFPHRTVAGNIGYGLTPQERASGRIDELLEQVGLAGYGDRRIDALSGGQAQRVALARALAPRPRLLLLDEPLAALDAALRGRILDLLHEVLRSTGTPAVFVTHDQQEAFAIADEVALMKDGHLHQQGDPRQLWQAPRDDWAADFVGYSTILAAGHGIPGAPPGRIALRPTALRVVEATGDGMLQGTVRTVRPTPDAVRLEVDVAGHLLPAVAGAVIEPGTTVALQVDPTGIATLRG